MFLKKMLSLDLLTSQEMIDKMHVPAKIQVVSSSGTPRASSIELNEVMKGRRSSDIARLEEYWRDFTLSFPWTKELDGAVVASYPKLPYYEPNHAGNINVDESAAEELLQKITKHLSTHGSPAIWFRVTPLTSPESFSSLLQTNGFKRDFETSVMTFDRNRLRDTVDPEIEVKEVSRNEIDVWKTLVCKVFGVPPDWREGFDAYVQAYIGGGARCYLAYVDDKPVGTCSLLSLNGCSGIFSLGTNEDYRRQGVGSALTVRAVRDSVSEGNSLQLLYVDRGEYAEYLYRKIGFEIDHTVVWFAKELWLT